VATKPEVYKRIKIAGLLSFIPFVLIGGVLAGYIAADFISGRFLPDVFAFPLCILAGLAASVIEVARIIKLTLRIERND
jgi:hypothetical protein